MPLYCSFTFKLYVFISCACLSILGFNLDPYCRRPIIFVTTCAIVCRNKFIYLLIDLHSEFVTHKMYKLYFSEVYFVI